MVSELPAGTTALETWAAVRSALGNSDVTDADVKAIEAVVLAVAVRRNKEEMEQVLQELKAAVPASTLAMACAAVMRFHLVDYTQPGATLAQEARLRDAAMCVIMEALGVEPTAEVREAAPHTDSCLPATHCALTSPRLADVKQEFHSQMAAASRLKDARWAWTAYQEMKRLGLPLQVAVCKQLIRALTRGKVHPHRGRGADSERAWTALTECVAQFATVHRPPAASGMWHHTYHHVTSSSLPPTTTPACTAKCCDVPGTAARCGAV